MATAQRLGTAELLFRCAQQMGLAPTWVTPFGTFAINMDGQERYINLRSPLNSATSAGLAKNKYLTRRILERHGMPNIPFTLPRAQAEAVVFLEQYGKIIAKPVAGFGAQDIHIITNQAELERLPITDYLLEKYILGKELRYLVLNSVVIGVYRSDYGTSVAENRPLQCISYPKTLWNPTLINSSLRVAEILGLGFAAIDYLTEASGRAYVLEVNTMPDLKWFHAPTSGPAVDVARLFLESALHDSYRKEPNLLAPHPAEAYSQSMEVA